MQPIPDLTKQTEKVAEELGLVAPDFNDMLSAIRKQKVIVQQRFIESLVNLYKCQEIENSLYGDYNEWSGRPRDYDLPFRDMRQTMVIYAVEDRILED